MSHSGRVAFGAMEAVVFGKPAAETVAEEAQRLDISETLVRTSRQSLNLTPATAREVEFQSRVKSCQDALRSVNTGN